MSQTLRVALYRFRTSFRRRWTGYLSVVLLIGSIGGLAMAASAGGRRTQSSFPTYVASTNPSTVALFTRYDAPQLGQSTGYDARLEKTIARLPFVDHASTAIIFDANINLNAVTGIHPHVLAGESPPTFVGSWDGEYSSMDRVRLIAGRLANPSRLNEAVMNVQAAEEAGVHIGSVVTIPFYTDAEINSSSNTGKPFLIAKVKVVGEVVAATNVVESDLNALKAAEVIFSPALTRLLAPQCSTGTETFLQIAGGDSNAKRVLAEVYKVDPAAVHFPSEITSAFVPSAQRAIEPEAIALEVFGGIAGLAVLLIAALMIGRILRVEADETDTLRALGANRAMMLVDQLFGVLCALLVGSLLAVVVAVGLSPLAPLGPIRPVYPNPGVAFDWTILGFGFLILVVVLGALTVLFARREVRRIKTSKRQSQLGMRQSRPVRFVANSGLPISAVAGVRFALEPGRGRNATPVRSAMLGAVLAVTVLVTTVTFGASLNSLVSHPALYGWNWNYAMISSFAGSTDLPSHQIATLLNQDRDVQAWSGVNFAPAKLDGQQVDVLAQRPGALVAPPMLSGHGLSAANEIILGSTTLSQIHKRVGDTIIFNNGISKPRKLLIVGTATMPAIVGGYDMGTGVLVSTSEFPTSLLNLQGNQIPGPNAILVRITAGIKPGAAYHSLQEINQKINAIPAADGSAGGVISVLRPVEIVNFHSMGNTPTIFAASLAIGATAALALTLGVSVRRRRQELALLKTLGFTQRQLIAAITWQASVAAVIGIAIGIPLGIIIGRGLWILFARNINAVPDPTVPTVTLVLIGAGAIVFAILVAAIPGRIAARTPTSLVLRAE